MKAYEKSQKTKRFLVMGLVAAMVAAMVALAGCGGDNSSSSSSSDDAYADLDPVTLIAGDSSSEGSACNQWGQLVAEKASEITGGKLTIDYHGLGELGGDVDGLRQEQANDIQIWVGQPAPAVSFIPELACMDLPMAFATQSAEQIDSVLNGDNEFSQGLQAAAEENGFHVLGWLQAATYRETTSNKELATLADYKGFQIRTMENANHMAFWKAVGAEPTPLAWSEVYFALQNGTVDGQENATDTCVGASLQEVQKYLCRTHHILYANMMSISKEGWDALDPAYQEALQQAVSDAAAEIAPQLAQMDVDNAKVMTDAGMTEITYDEDFFTEFKNNEGVQKVYSDISKQTNGLSDKMLAAIDAA
ncbi:MAG: TRAP transporter substrate-binding protein [Eggerthellales bacterium]|nr:TRAP transporter substrate-binding protein [Eggerthellales bacterium]